MTVLEADKFLASAAALLLGATSSFEISGSAITLAAESAPVPHPISKTNKTKHIGNISTLSGFLREKNLLGSDSTIYNQFRACDISGFITSQIQNPKSHVSRISNDI